MPDIITEILKKRPSTPQRSPNLGILDDILMAGEAARTESLLYGGQELEETPFDPFDPSLNEILAPGYHPPKQELSEVEQILLQPDPDDDPETLLDKSVKSFKAGVADLIDVSGGAALWAGFDETGKAFREYAKEIHKETDLEEFYDEFEWSDLQYKEFYFTKGVRMLPSMLTLIPVAIAGGAIGGAAATALGGGRVAFTITQAVSAALASRPLESAMEAGGTYNQAIDEGYSPEVAGEVAADVFVQNMALVGMDAVQFALAFAKIPIAMRPNMAGWINSKALRGVGFAAAGVSEGYEEVIQNYFQELGQATAAGELPPDLILNVLNASKEAKESFALGTLGGLGFQTVGAVTRALTDGKMTPKEIDQLINEHALEAAQAQSQQTGEAVSEIMAAAEVAGEPIKPVSETKPAKKEPEPLKIEQKPEKPEHVARETKELPAVEPEAPITYEFVGMQEQINDKPDVPQYNIMTPEHPRYKSTVTLTKEELKPEDIVKGGPLATEAVEVYTDEKGLIYAVDEGPAGNWTIYKKDDIGKKGQRLKADLGGELGQRGGFFAEKEDAQAALVQYAEKTGLKEYEPVAEVPVEKVEKKIIGEEWKPGQLQYVKGDYKTDAAAKAGLTNWLKGVELAPGMVARVVPATKWSPTEMKEVPGVWAIEYGKPKVEDKPTGLEKLKKKPTEELVDKGEYFESQYRYHRDEDEQKAQVKRTVEALGYKTEEEANKDLRANEEDVLELSPHKKGWVSSNSIEVTHTENGLWAYGTMTNFHNSGTASGPSIYNSEWYKTREGAIVAAAKDIKRWLEGELEREGESVPKSWQPVARRWFKELDAIIEEHGGTVEEPEVKPTEVKPVGLDRLKKEAPKKLVKGEDPLEQQMLEELRKNPDELKDILENPSAWGEQWIIAAKKVQAEKLEKEKWAQYVKTAATFGMVQAAPSVEGAKKVTLHPPVKAEIDLEGFSEGLAGFLDERSKTGETISSERIDEFLGRYGLEKGFDWGLKWDRRKKPSATTQPLTPNFIKYVPENKDIKGKFEYEQKLGEIATFIRGHEPKITIQKNQTFITWIDNKAVPIDEGLIEHTKELDTPITVKTVKPRIRMILEAISPKPLLGEEIASTQYKMLLEYQKELAKKGIDPEYVASPVWTVGKDGKDHVLIWEGVDRSYQIKLEENIADMIKQVAEEDDIVGVRVEFSEEFFGKRVAVPDDVNIMGVELGLLGFTPQNMKLLFDGLIATGNYVYKDLPLNLKMQGRKLGINKENFNQRFNQFAEGTKKFAKNVVDWFNKVWQAIRAWYAKSALAGEGGFIDYTRSNRTQLLARAYALQDEVDLSAVEIEELKVQMFGEGKLTELADPDIQKYIDNLVLLISKKEKVGLKRLKKRIDEKVVLKEKPVLIRKFSSTLIKDRIRALKRGVDLGAAERTKELEKLKMMIQRYARTELPKYLITRGQITPLLTQVAKAKNINDVVRAFDRIDAIRGKVEKKTALDKFAKIIKRYSPKKKHGKVVGTILMPKEYRSLRDINNIVGMDRPTINETIAKIMMVAENQERDINELENRLIYLLGTYGDLKNKTPAQIITAVEDMESIITVGKTIHQLLEENRKRYTAGLRNKTVSNITEGKGVLPEMKQRELKVGKIGKRLSGLKDFLYRNQSFEYLMDILEGKEKTTGILRGFMAQRFGNVVHEARQEENRGTREKYGLIQEKLKEIFGIKSARKLTKVLNVNAVERVNTGILLKDGTELIITKNEAYKKWMEWQDPELAETFEKMGYTEETIKDLENFIGPELIKWAEWQLDEFYPQYYQEINEVFKERFFIDLPQHDFYSPRQREGKEAEVEDELLLNSTNVYASLINSSLKARIKNTRALKYLDGDTVLKQHVAQMEHFMAWAMPMQELRSVLGSGEVQRAIKQEYGMSPLKILNNFLDDFARGGMDRTQMIRSLDKLRAGFVKSKIGLNLTVFVKQLTSIPAYLIEIPVVDYAKGMTSFWKNPVKNFKTLMDSEMMKARYTVGHERDIILALERTTPEKFSGVKKFTDQMMIFTRAGDALAIVSGGWSIYKYYYDNAIKGGKSDVEAKRIAMNRFERATKRSQQAGDIEDLGDIQRGGSFARLFTLFMTAPNQYFRAEVGAIRGLVRGRGKKSQHIKILMITHFILPMLFQLAANGFRWREKKQLRAMLVGSLNGLLIFGDMIEMIVDALVGNYVFEHEAATPFSIIGEVTDVFKALNKAIDEWDWDLETIVDVADKTAVPITTYKGIPYEPGKRLATGWYDYLTGETDVSPRLLGYSEWALGERQSESTGLERLKKQSFSKLQRKDLR